jgi:hypothetical protein
MVSPDLTFEQAEELIANWEKKLLAEKKRGENQRAMSTGPQPPASPDVRTHAAATILDL